MDPRRKQEAADVIRDFFQEEPGASIDACAKILSNQKLPIELPVISSIRRQIRLSGNYTRPALVLVSAQPEVTVSSMKPQAEPLPVSLPPKSKLEELHDRRAYLNQIVEKNPSITPTEAINAVKKMFGRGTDPQYTIQTITVARELAGAPLKKGAKKAIVETKKIVVPPKPEPKRIVIRPIMNLPKKPQNVFTQPTTVTARPSMPERPAYKTPVAPPARDSVTAKAPALRSVSWKEVGTSSLRWELVGTEEVKEKVSSLVNKGVDATTIQIWDLSPTQIKVKVKTEIDFGD